MVTIQSRNFSLQQICASGQCFRMEELGAGRYRLVAFGKCLEISQEGGTISFDCTEEEYGKTWRNYFDMERDYEAVISSIDPDDQYLAAAAEFGRGIRILHQDLWEMIISFIVSQQNHIGRIRRCIRLLCAKYGEERLAANQTAYHTFPAPRALADAALADLYACNLGYRSRYVQETARLVQHGGIDLDSLWEMDYKTAKKELLRLCGVGTKVADCICLFALNKTDAFPRDTHINKVLAAQYPEGFPFERYGGYSGILQQYLFYYDLNHTDPKQG